MALESNGGYADVTTRTKHIGGISGCSKGPGLLTISPGIYCDVQELFSLSYVRIWCNLLLYQGGFFVLVFSNLTFVILRFCSIQFSVTLAELKNVGE